MGLVAKAFQDIITFSRASSGTYVNSNGYITNSSVLNYLTYSNQPENAAWTKSNSFVQQNLLLYSEDFTNAAWAKFQGGTGVVPVVTANQGIAPDGTLTADRIVFDRGAGTTSSDISYLNQTFTSVSADCTGSFWLKTFDGSTKTITVRVGNTFNYTQTVTGTWTRVSLTGTSPITRIDLLAYGDQQVRVTDLLVWGSQLVQGSVPGDYRATTTAALPCLYADYNGALRARKLCEDATASVTHRILPGTALTIDAAGTYTYSWYVKAGELTEARLTDNNVLGATFNLTTGASSSVSSGYTASSVSLSNGWWRLIISGAAVTANGRILIYLSKAGSTTYTGDGSSGIYIADAQLNDGSSALAYYDTTASAYNAPRFDYDPVTLAAKGLLVEEQRANFLIRSSDFSNSVWNNASPNIPTVTTDATLSPDGTVNADLLTAATGGTACQARQPGATGTTGNFTASVFLKVGSATRNRILLTDHTSVFTVVGDFQVAWTAGVASVFSTASGTASVVAAGNGWYRCVVTASTASANAVMGIAIFPDPVAGTGSVYAWQAQLEAGAFASSVIPTVASQVTRAADVASVNTLSPWYNSVAGTLYAEFLASVDATGTYRTQLRIVDAGSTNYVQIRYQNPSATTAVTNNQVVAGTTQADLTSVSLSAPAILKTALSFAANNFSACTNGATPVTDVSGTMPTGLASLSFTGGSFNSGQTWMRRITYYPRVFTAAEQQTLTTL